MAAIWTLIKNHQTKFTYQKSKPFQGSLVSWMAILYRRQPVKKQCLNKLTYSKSRPGELCVFLPRALEVGFTFSLLILCMILLMSFWTAAFFLIRTGCKLYVSVFHCPYNRYRAWYGYTRNKVLNIEDCTVTIWKPDTRIPD